MNNYKKYKCSKKINKQLKNKLILIANTLSWKNFLIPECVFFDEDYGRIHYKDDEDFDAIERNLYVQIINETFDEAYINFENINFIKNSYAVTLCRITDQKMFLKKILYLIKDNPHLVFRLARWLDFFDRFTNENKVLFDKLVNSILNNIDTNELLMNQLTHELHLSMGFYCVSKEEIIRLQNVNQHNFEFLLNLSLFRGRYPVLFRSNYTEALRFIQGHNDLITHDVCLKHIFFTQDIRVDLSSFFNSTRSIKKFDCFKKIVNGEEIELFEKVINFQQLSLTKKENLFLTNLFYKNHKLVNLYFHDNITSFELIIFIKLCVISNQDSELALEFAQLLYKTIEDKNQIKKQIEFWKCAYIKFLTFNTQDAYQIIVSEYFNFIYTMKFFDKKNSFYKMDEMTIWCKLYSFEKQQKRELWNKGLTCISSNFISDTINYENETYYFKEITNTFDLLDVYLLNDYILFTETQEFLNKKTTIISIEVMIYSQIHIVGFLSYTKYSMTYFYNDFFNLFELDDEIIKIWMSKNNLNQELYNSPHFLDS